MYVSPYCHTTIYAQCGPSRITPKIPQHILKQVSLITNFNYIYSVIKDRLSNSVFNITQLSGKLNLNLNMKDSNLHLHISMECYTRHKTSPTTIAKTYL
jgi:hypothetical protein